jgi:hypothetical protein
MRRTTVPKATIDEDGDLCAQERHVRTPARSGQRGIYAIAEPERTQGRAECELARSIALMRHLHAMAHVLR